MSNVDAAIFKARLELKTIKPEEIQEWAIATLEADSSNVLALEICFFSKPKEVVTHFKKMSKNIFSQTLTEKIINDLLKDYINKNLSLFSIKEAQRSLIQKLLHFSNVIESKELFELLNYYDDQFYLSSEGYTSSEPDIVFQDLINDLKNFLSNSN
ncbi:hypothetical protein [Acinetobacter piscicola]|uniref:hypothetical protein n=1 Tax=Acinetobacter piscicola TaxID=2006115 RepID=UPI000B7FBE96|nr:hypothetical protein [Acinetobacter piscicola]